jgi:hypothetical protein
MAVLITAAPSTSAPPDDTDPDPTAPAISIVITPATLVMGEVPVGDEVIDGFTVHNEGSDEVRIDHVILEGEGFSIHDDGCTGSPLAEGDRCVVEVEFAPTEAGTFEGTLTFETLAADFGRAIVGIGAAVPASTDPLTTIPDVVPTTPTTTPPPATTTPAPVTTTPGGGGGEDEELLERCEERAASAQLRFSPTDRMVVGEVDQVEVVASVDESFPDETDGPPDTTIVPVRLRCEVAAQVRGAAFEIEPQDFQEGSFLDAPTITWRWDVRPLETGELTLTLDIRSVVVVDGRRLVGSSQLYSTDITVDAAPQSVPQHISGWFDALIDYPLVRGFGSLAAVAAAAAAGWRWILKRPWPWAARGRRSSDGSGPGEPG